MSESVMQGAPNLPPQRGGIEGGETRVVYSQPSQLWHPGNPTLNPSPEGRETWRALHGPRENP